MTSLLHSNIFMGSYFTQSINTQILTMAYEAPWSVLLMPMWPHDLLLPTSLICPFQTHLSHLKYQASTHLRAFVLHKLLSVWSTPALFIN